MHSSRPNPFVNRQPLKPGGRETFLARVRKALDHPESQSPAPTSPPPIRDESVIRQVPRNATKDQLISRFTERAAKNTITVHRVPADPAAIHAAIDQCFASHQIKSSILNARELGERFGLAQHLANKSIQTLHWGQPNSFKASFTCDASITDARAGIADTGAFLVWSDQSFGRSSTLVVPVHIILLPVSKILPDMIDALDLVTRENANMLPSNVVIINGPSKTADIEMTLVTGVHGPKYLYTLLIDNI